MFPNILVKMNEHRNSAEEITSNLNVDKVSVIIASRETTQNAASTY